MSRRRSPNHLRIAIAIIVIILIIVFIVLGLYFFNYMKIRDNVGNEITEDEKISVDKGAIIPRSNKKYIEDDVAKPTIKNTLHTLCNYENIDRENIQPAILSYIESIEEVEVPYIDPIEDCKDNPYILDMLGGKWDEELFNKMISEGKIVLEEEDINDTDDIVYMKNNKPYVKSSDLKFTKAGMAYVRYRGSTYFITKARAGLQPKDLKDYQAENFILTKLINQTQEGQDTYSIDLYYITYDEKIKIGFNTEIDKNGKPVSIKTIQYENKK